ncbi:hypothetical protein CspeluHIS016_0802090 [Cutaneotrichosporon spelunceum]|uniref:Uncharacterized protein n=1 Tax=Cutaneotrichosporon spelunceum TaxID=1672016 RepID=A0AAD3YEY1_9TREE|nr:hypothetical protein CspeluHIS016_0802090 [Cutaneotrichosporon spelunceum]
MRLITRPARLVQPALTRGFKLKPKDKVDNPPLPMARDEAAPPEQNMNFGRNSAASLANAQGTFVNHLKDVPDVNKQAQEADEAAVKKEEKK